MSDFRKLLVWQKAYLLELDVDRAVERMRGARRAALRSQLLRSSHSISSNIVEGSGENSPREYARYIRSAINSSNETEHHLLIARDTKSVPRFEVERLLGMTVEVRKMLYGLLRYLKGLSGGPRRPAPNLPHRTALDEQARGGEEPDQPPSS
jgi:four helix bundle protein